MQETLNQEVESTIRTFIDVNVINGAAWTYNNETPLLDESILDSLGVVDLVEFLQKRFRIRIQQEEVTRKNFRSVSTIAAFVRDKTSPMHSSVSNGN
ncbi:MAG: hypothetical protein DMG64_02210 [Acidobacteria bacterium]|nr:MAG: hypothetical protein DMG63_10605 [Acidobacteriota bacterium]PYY05925.1 MAG: hypothetical protein DMG64_02210 [Acidobacteriota bacterium]PYY21135.1 MAG: hypothetical protein DMG62_20120 [Acidobacteriota bacterium]